MLFYEEEIEVIVDMADEIFLVRHPEVQGRGRERVRGGWGGGGVAERDPNGEAEGVTITKWEE